MSMVENKVDECKEYIANSLIAANPAQLVEIIGLLELMPEQPAFAEVIRLLKIKAFLKFKQALVIPTMTYTSYQKRYYTALMIDIEKNSIYLLIGAKDAKNLNDMYVRLYDLHRDEMLEMLPLCSPETHVLVGVN